MTNIKSFFTHLTAPGYLAPAFPGRANTPSLSVFGFIKAKSKKIQVPMPEFTYLQKTMSGILLRQEEILKAFSVLTTGLLITFLIIFKTLGLFSTEASSQLIVFSPLLLNVVLLIAVYNKKKQAALFIISWLSPALLTAVAVYNPAINFSRILVIYMLVVLFVNRSALKRFISFGYLTLAYTFIHLQYFTQQARLYNNPGARAEVFMMPIFCLVLFVVVSRIRKEFGVYQKEIRLQKEELEEKNSSLETLFSFSEQQRHKLKSTVLLKEKLISVISHDVRVPINAFKFLIDGYQKGYMTEAVMIEGIIETRKDLVNIDKMVLDLVNWSRGEKSAAEKQNIGFRELHDIMDSVLSIYSLCAKNKELQIIPVIDMPENMGLSIPRRDLEIILRNLLSNAIKFSNRQGNILVHLRAEQGSTSPVVSLVVKDFGTGMSAGMLDRLNGNRVISSMGTQDEVGLGIGLSIVFDVIHNHGLVYNITSEVKQGTEFMIDIPMITC